MVHFLLDNKEEEIHEKIYRSVIKNSEIPTILAKYGYNFEDILLDDSKGT